MDDDERQAQVGKKAELAFRLKVRRQMEIAKHSACTESGTCKERSDGSHTVVGKIESFNELSISRNTITGVW